MLKNENFAALLILVLCASADERIASVASDGDELFGRRGSGATLVPLVAGNGASLSSTPGYYNNEQIVVAGRPTSGADIWPNFLWRDRSNLPKCAPIQAEIPEKVDLLGFQLLFAVLYFVVWFGAVSGNLSVIYVVTLKQVKLSSVRSVFICNLALSDMVLSLTSLPITAVSIFTRDWIFPKLFCNFIGVFQGGSIFVSSFTLTAIAIDRYFLVRHPGTDKINVRNAMLIVVLIWLVGYLFALPVGIFSATADYRPFCGRFCEEFWPDSDEMGTSQMRKSYGITVLVIQFGLPVMISSLCYWSIGQIITEQLTKRKQHQIILQESQHRLESRKSRSSRMMLSMVMGLVLAWLPMNLINLWRDFDSAERFSEWYSLIFALCHVTAMTSAAWNPIIYSWFNPQFKDTIRHALERRKRRRSSEAVLGTPAPLTARCVALTADGGANGVVNGASTALFTAGTPSSSNVAGQQPS